MFFPEQSIYPRKRFGLGFQILLALFLTMADNAKPLGFSNQELFFSDFEDGGVSSAEMGLSDQDSELLPDSAGGQLLRIQGEPEAMSRGPVVTIPAGNQDRGIRLTLAARKR